MKFLTLLLISGILINMPGFSQKKKFSPASYITQNGDTVNGYLYIKNKKTFSSFSFKDQLDDAKEYTVLLDTCKSVSSEKVNFMNCLVTRSMTYIDRLQYDIRNVDSFITASIPLRLLYKGRQLSLYYYYDVKDHFFVYDQEKMQELMIRYRYPTQFENLQNINVQAAKYYINPIYRDQIATMVNNQLTWSQAYALYTAEYEELPLIKVFKSLDK